METAELQKEENVSAEGPSANELLEQIEKLRSTNERLLEESAKNKQRFSQVRDKYQDLEKMRLDKLSAEERLKEHERLLAEKESELDSARSKTMKANIRSIFGSLAKDAHDVDDLLSNANFSSEDVDDEELTIKRDRAENLVNKLREQKPYLFKNHSLPSMSNTPPSYQTPQAKKFDDLTQDEIIQLMKQQRRS